MNKFLDILSNILTVILCILSLPFIIIFAAIAAVVYAIGVIITLPYWIGRCAFVED